MSTRSRIGLLNKDGTVDSVYCHFDGYIDGNGCTLFKSYPTADHVRNLMVKGDLSSLGDCPETTEYYVDRGEDPEELKPRANNTIHGFLSEREEYMYYIDETTNKWFVSKHGREVLSLEEAIDNDADCDDDEE